MRSKLLPLLAMGALLGALLWNFTTQDESPGQETLGSGGTPQSPVADGKAAESPDASELDPLSLPAATSDRQSLNNEDTKLTGGQEPVELEEETELVLRSRHSARLLQKTLQDFREDRSTRKGMTLLEKAAIAWADHSGVSVSIPEGQSAPFGTMTADEWTILLADPFGNRQIPVYADEIPEFWEALELETEVNRKALDDQSRQQLLDRWETRAQTVLDLVSEG